jgi:hypothetical protein
MKNIHILPTDKPSRLFIYDGKLGLANGFQYGSDAIQNQEIYITSDEKIKEGDWFLPHKHINPHKLKGYNKISGDLESYNGLCYDISKCKRIILTTDQDLIEDGVQAIDDEFLEWFVNNPSCEEVDVKKLKSGKYWLHKAIIPKEIDVLELGQIIPKEEPKKYKVMIVGDGLHQQTLEEAKANLFRYSEEEVINFNLKYLQELGKNQSENGKWMNFKEWFELNKKK